MRGPRNLNDRRQHYDARNTFRKDERTIRRSHRLLKREKEDERRVDTREDTLLTVVVVANLLLILALGVPEDIGNELGEDVLEELRGKDHLCPVVTGLENVEHVTCGGEDGGWWG